MGDLRIARGEKPPLLKGGGPRKRWRDSLFPPPMRNKPRVVADFHVRFLILSVGSLRKTCRGNSRIARGRTQFAPTKSITASVYKFQRSLSRRSLRIANPIYSAEKLSLPPSFACGKIHLPRQREKKGFCKLVILSASEESQVCKKSDFFDRVRS